MVVVVLIIRRRDSKFHKKTMAVSGILKQPLLNINRKA
jgi:hypothetical protein